MAICSRRVIASSSRAVFHIAIETPDRSRPRCYGLQRHLRIRRQSSSGRKASEKMRAVILGGCGSMGSEATRDLATTSDFDEITIADLNKEKAQSLADSLNTSTGRGHVKAEYIDASDEDALAALLRKQDVVVNTMTYHFGLQATR